MTCNIYYIATALSLTPKLGRNIIRSLARSLPSALAAGRDSLTLSKQLMNRKASVFILKSKESFEWNSGTAEVNSDTDL